MKKNIFRIISGGILGVFLAFITVTFQDRFYIEGMILDNTLLNQLTDEQKSILKSNNAYRVYAKYNIGSEAYIVNNQTPNFVSMHVGMWNKERTIIDVSSFSMQARKADSVSHGSGLAFHTIDGELYAYSKGDIRNNVTNFNELINDLVNDFEELVLSET